MTGISNVAVIGVGYWGRNLARNFAELGSLAAVVDTNEEAAADVAASTGSAARTLDEVLADSSVEGLAIATRAETHHEVAKRALEAGKHVFVEKPLVLNEHEADELISLASEHKRVLLVGHLLRYHPVFRSMLEIVRSGEFGKLRYIHSDRMSLGKIRTEEDVLWSFSPHDISMVLALAGQEPSGVTAQGAGFINPAIADIVTLQLAFPNGVKAGIRASWMHYRKSQLIAAVCDNATIVFEDSEPEWERKLAIHEHRVEHKAGIPIPQRGEMRHVEVPRAEPLKLECEHFLTSIRGDTEPLTDGQEGRAVLRVLQRAAHDLGLEQAQ
jgi:UDP-2-acetamido-3-amino-2,3-dideoxy-glucuronate N-acetyltransferase